MQLLKSKDANYTPDVIARNIKRVGEGVVEIKRYSDSGIRYLAWSWFLMVLGFWTYGFITQDLVYDEIQWAISPDSRLIPQYERLKNNYIDMGIQLSELGSYQEFKQDMMIGHGYRRYWGAFYMLFPVFLFFCVVSPRWRPLRIDTKRRLVYFWLWGQFYITRYPKHLPLNVLYSRMHQPKLRLPEHAALVLKIPHESKAGKFTEVDLGIFRPACNYQNYVLYNFLQDYLSSDNPEQEFARYFEKENTLFSDYLNRFFYRFSLFPDRGYNEKKTEAKIQAWLATHPESDDDFLDTQGNLDQLMHRLLEK